mmetsp:Transcript_11085/g.35173  ORF Transcript_11085/g.35173 Transcript_11085/m.35173 type:complete len:255 (-) Transcript_11085:414-1178(-)
MTERPPSPRARVSSALEDHWRRHCMRRRRWRCALAPHSCLRRASFSSALHAHSTSMERIHSRVAAWWDASPRISRRSVCARACTSFTSSRSSASSVSSLLRSMTSSRTSSAQSMTRVRMLRCPWGTTTTWTRRVTWRRWRLRRSTKGAGMHTGPSPGMSDRRLNSASPSSADSIDHCSAAVMLWLTSFNSNARPEYDERVSRKSFLGVLSRGFCTCSSDPGWMNLPSAMLERRESHRPFRTTLTCVAGEVALTI